VKAIRTFMGISLVFCMLFGLALISLCITEIEPTATNLEQQQTVRGLHTPGLHAKICIINNTDFAIQAASQGWDGNGLPGTPYVISDYVIIDPGDPGIAIYDTTVYFIIQNVTVRDTYPYEGFKLNNVTNGELRNCLGINASFGFTDLQNTILSSNIAVNISGGAAFTVLGSQNTLFNNTVENAYGSGAIGFYISGSSNFLSNNTAKDCEEFGFHISGSSNILLNNTATFNKHGFYISGSDNTLASNFAITNSQNGFILEFYSQNTLIYNTAFGNDVTGFSLVNTTYNILVYNTATENGVNGISLNDASQNILVRNTATDNGHGLSLTSSNYNTVGANILSPNAEGCIWESGCVGNIFDGNTCEEDGGSDIPGFNLAILLGMLAVISAVFFLRKHQCGHLKLY
jgi:parallel beta-helix repeat protein